MITQTISAEHRTRIQTLRDQLFNLGGAIQDARNNRDAEAYIAIEDEFLRCEVEAICLRAELDLEV